MNNLENINNIDNIKRRKRSLEINEYEEIKINNIVNDLKEINLNNSNNEIMQKMIKKMCIIEKKIDDFVRIEIKLDKLNKKVDDLSTEKDYVIDNLKDEIFNLKSHINEIENKCEKNYSNDYFC